MKAIFLATASCCPTGRPHCTRSADHSRATLSDHLPAPTHIAGSDSRPVLSVVSAIFRPLPRPPMTFSAGTNTSWNRVTLFSRPRRPRNSLRRSTVMPGASPSTTNAVIALAPGTRAITTSRVATVPLVAQSFTPVEPVAALDRLGDGAQAGRVGADVRLGEQERGHLARRPAGAGTPSSARRCRRS